MNFLGNPPNKAPSPPFLATAGFTRGLMKTSHQRSIDPKNHERLYFLLTSGSIDPTLACASDDFHSLQGENQALSEQ
jgi:hypothetical protein